jgi:hypothetical protein
MCTLTLTAIDSPSGAKFECTTGPNSGLSLSVNSKEQCIAQKFPATCPIKVGDLITCYKAAKTDACSALAQTGACGTVLSQAKACTG